MKLIQNNLEEKYNESYFKYLKKTNEYDTSIFFLENEDEMVNFRYCRWLFYNQNVIKYLFDIGYMGKVWSYNNWKSDIENSLIKVKKYIIPIIGNSNIKNLANSYFGIQTLNNKIFKSIFKQNKNVAYFSIINDFFLDNNNNISIPTHSKELLTSMFKNNIDYYFVKWLFHQYNTYINNNNNYFFIDENYEPKKKSYYNMIYLRYTAGNNYQKNKDLLFFGINLLFLKIGLELLQLEGTLIIRDTIPSYYFKIQLYYIISSFFESYEIIFENQDLYMCIIYKNLKKKTNVFSVLFDEYQKYDLSLGKKYLNIFDINFDFNIEVDQKFKYNFDNLNKEQNNFLKIKKKRLEYIKKKITKNPKYIEKIINFNIYKGLQTVKELGLKINPYYKNDFFKLSDINKKKFYFPKAIINYNKLQYDYETTFSITDEKTANIISKIIKLKYPNTKIVADMTANVGGNTLNFAKYFNKIYSIEYNKNTYDMLNNNIKVYGFKNIETFNEDANNFNKNADIYFYDPPWTGILYKSIDYLDLFLGGKNIVDTMYSNFCLKAPSNYNINKLVSKFKNISIYELKNYLIIINNTNECNNCIKPNKLLIKNY